MKSIVKNLILDLFVTENSKFLPIKERIQIFIETELPILLETFLDKAAPKDVIIELDNVSLDLFSYTDTSPTGNLDLGYTHNFKTSIIQNLQTKIKLEIDKSIADPQKKNIYPLPVAMQNAIENYLKNGYFDWWIPVQNQKAIEKIYIDLLQRSPELIKKLWRDLDKNTNAIQRFTSQFKNSLIQSTLKIIDPTNYNSTINVFHDLESISKIIIDNSITSKKYTAYIYTSLLFTLINSSSYPSTEENILDSSISNLASISGFSKLKLEYLLESQENRLTKKKAKKINEISFPSLLKELDPLVKKYSESNSESELDLIIFTIGKILNNSSSIQHGSLIAIIKKITPQSLFLERLITQLKPDYLPSFIEKKNILLSKNDENSSLYNAFYTISLEEILSKKQNVKSYNEKINKLLNDTKFIEHSLLSDLSQYFDTGSIPTHYNGENNFFSTVFKSSDYQILDFLSKILATNVIRSNAMNKLVKPLVVLYTKISTSSLKKIETIIDQDSKIKLQNLKIDFEPFLYSQLLKTFLDTGNDEDLVKITLNNISKKLNVDLKNILKETDFIFAAEYQDDLEKKESKIKDDWDEFITFGKSKYSDVECASLLESLFTLQKSQYEEILENTINSSLGRARMISCFEITSIEKFLNFLKNTKSNLFTQEIIYILSSTFRHVSNTEIKNHYLNALLLSATNIKNNSDPKVWVTETLNLLTQNLDFSKSQLLNLIVSKGLVQETSLETEFSQFLLNLDTSLNYYPNKDLDEYEKLFNGFIPSNDSIDLNLHRNNKRKDLSNAINQEIINTLKKNPSKIVEVLLQHTYLQHFPEKIVSRLGVDITTEIIKNFSQKSYSWIEENILSHIPENLSKQEKIFLREKNLTIVLEYFLYINNKKDSDIDRSEMQEFWSKTIDSLYKSNSTELSDLDKNVIISKEEKTFYINNGCIALIWPFIEDLFEKLGFVKDSEFVDIACRNNAVHVLNYLCTGRLSTSEWKLILPKILCGISVEENIYYSYEPTDGPLPINLEFISLEMDIFSTEKLAILGQKERLIHLEIYNLIQVCEKWLSNVLEEWGNLKSLSIYEAFKKGINGKDLREYFLQRKCILKRISDSDNIFWHLTVPIYEYDTPKIIPPWSLDSIDLPWIKEKLVIHWIMH